MTRISTFRLVSGRFAAIAFVLLLAVFGSMALAQQDRYTLKLGELAFSDFRGYENWKVVAVSQTETLLKVIVANDVIMDAYRQGLPAEGQAFSRRIQDCENRVDLQKEYCVPVFRDGARYTQGGCHN